MKIAGRENLTLDRAPLTLRRRSGDDITLTFEALPAGYNEIIQEELPDPKPPIRGFEVWKGKVLRDEDGRAIPKVDTDDVEYRKAVRLNNRRQSVAMIVRSLWADDAVAFPGPPASAVAPASASS